MSSSPSHSTTCVPLITMCAEAMSVVDVLAEVREHLAHRLEADAGVEQGLDHAQLEQVAVASTAAGCRCPSASASDGRIRSVRAQ